MSVMLTRVFGNQVKHVLTELQHIKQRPYFFCGLTISLINIFIFLLLR